MWRIVLDTNVLVSSRRSRSGASNMLLRHILDGKVRLLASVPLFVEYEAVLSRPEQLRTYGLDQATVTAFLDLLSTATEEVRLHYMWRPQLNDPADEMVLEAAINGNADFIVTFNGRHFDAASGFGIRVADPATFLKEFK